MYDNQTLSTLHTSVQTSQGEGTDMLLSYELFPFISNVDKS